MIYINTTGKQNQVWLPKPYDIIINDCPDADDAYNSGYTSGYTDGLEDGYGSGYTSGYTDGLNACSGGSCEGIWEEGYDSGYTDGQASVDCTDFYNSGVTDGYDSGYTSGYTDGVNACSGGSYQDGYDDGYGDGWDVGYDSGKTDGIAEQKSKLTSTAFTSNGTYTRADGWSSVTVDVAQTGYTQEDLDAAYNSGWTNGYDTGYADGQSDCTGSTAATAVTFSVPEELNPGESGSTSVDIRPSGAPTDLSYSSSDPSVATIDSAGTITALSTGYTNICVTDSISQITTCRVLSVIAPLTGNADVTATVKANNAGDSVLISAQEGMGSVAKMAIDGVEITPVSSYTFGDTNIHTLEVWYLGSTVPYSAFEKAGCLRNVIISDRMTLVGGRAFFDCTGLTSVHIGSGVTAINGGVFKNCRELTSVTIPDNVTSLGNNVFELCRSLTDVILGAGITAIPEYAFSDCTGLTSLTVNGNITDIGSRAFANCYSLTAYPFTTETSIGRLAFSACRSFQSAIMPNTVTSLGEGAFRGCTNITTINISSGLTEIPVSAYSECTSLTGVVMPNTITKVDEEAFQGCSVLTSVTLSNSLTTIGTNAFSYDPYLRGIDIPSSVTSIGAWAFRFDAGLNVHGITVRNPIPPTLGNGVFQGSDDAIIYVPAQSVETYKSQGFWREYASRIQAIQ